MNDREPMSEFELEQSKLWWQRWTIFKYLLIGLRRILLWILGLGIGLSAFMDAMHKVFGSHK